MAVATADGERVRQARASILGFACNQAFLLALLYLGVPGASAPEARWGSLVAVPLCMIAAFLALTRPAPRRALARLTSSLVATCGVPLVLFALGVTILGALGSLPGAVIAAAQGVLVGVPAALLLCAWGRVLGRAPIEQSVPEVLIGSALGAAVCLAAVAVPAEAAPAALYLLPLGSAGALRALGGAEEAAPATDEARPSDAADDDGDAGRLTGRILAGTAVYGVAAGAVEALALGGDAAGSLAPTLFFFVLYCLAALQLYGERPLAGVRAVLPVAGAADAGPLDGAWRLAVLLMMGGFLLVPLLGIPGIPGQAVALAGYLGVFVALISLFLVMGRLTGRDAALSFARGFSALFAGELAGLGAGLALGGLPLGREAPFAVVALAGIAVLYAYLFLFTDRDLRALSVAVERTDRLEEACRRIAADAGLSKREAELLPLALRGRTSERMAAELFISKNTVDTHMRRIYAKCGVRSRQELIDLGERVERELPPTAR